MKILWRNSYTKQKLENKFMKKMKDLEDEEEKEDKEGNSKERFHRQGRN